jgi:hypothetical protein
MAAQLCIGELLAQHYQRTVGVALFGQRAFTHLAQISVEGQPRRCYVKAFPSATDGRPSRCLLNEIVGYTLAHHLQLPQPKAFLIWLPNHLLKAISAAWPYENGLHLCFASLEAHNPNDATQGCARVVFNENIATFVHAIAQWPTMPALIGFDSWIANTDRNGGNLMVTGKNSYSIIDHSDILTGPVWKNTDLDPEGWYQNKLLAIICKAQQLSLPAKSAILKTCDDFWSAYSRALPELQYWLRGDSGSDTLLAHHFIWKRVELTKQLLNQELQMVA